VQLNINNPHFLIMQGRITKVLNMKATEILSMVEEAAGTKMFEDRKNKAFATMAKKDRKVTEINSVSKDYGKLCQLVKVGLQRLLSLDTLGRDHTKTGSSSCRKAILFGVPKN
jgi:chromosome segregation ATPase